MKRMEGSSISGDEHRKSGAKGRVRKLASMPHAHDAQPEWLRQLAHRPDRVTAGARATLAVISLLVEWIDSSHPPSEPEIVRSILAGYLVYALLSVVASWSTAHQETGRWALARQVFDLVVVAILMALTGGPESPYFMFFPFVLISGALFWRWRGALATALASLGILATLIVFDPLVMIDPDTNQTIDVSRFAFVVVSAILLVWMGLREDGVQSSLRRIASHPLPLQASHEWPWDAALQYAAHVTLQPQLALIWTDPYEPWTYVAVSDRGQRRLVRIEAGLVEAREEVPSSGARRADIVRELGGSMVVAMPLELGSMKGELLVVDPPHLSAEQDAIAEIVGQRVALMFDQARQIRRMLANAKLQQRVQIAHDLHDSVLQTLTGTTLQLEDVKTLAAHAPERVSGRVQAIQQMLAEEQRVLRQMINTLEIDDAPASRMAPLEPTLAELVSRLRSQWALDVTHRVEPQQLRLPTRLIEELCHFVTEATSNAAKHGQATKVDLVAQHYGSSFEMIVMDDGRGFGFGRELSHRDLSARGLGPVRLRERAVRCAGSLSIDDSDGMTVVRVRIPLEGLT